MCSVGVEVSSNRMLNQNPHGLCHGRDISGSSRHYQAVPPDWLVIFSQLSWAIFSLTRNLKHDHILHITSSNGQTQRSSVVIELILIGFTLLPGPRLPSRVLTNTTIIIHYSLLHLFKVLRVR